VAAFHAARRCGLVTIALTGMDGGEIGSLADLPLIVPSQQTERIQEVHMIVLHILCDLIEKSQVKTPALPSSYLLPVMQPAISNNSVATSRRR
jgi:DNA-binding MurR/RpiR family transcriptional regulator